MDLVNRDVKVRDELKDAYAKHRRIGGVESTDGTAEEDNAARYLTAEPNVDQTNHGVSKEVKLEEPDNEEKWPIGFFAQMLILFSRSFYLSGKEQFTVLEAVQCIVVAVVIGLCWFQMEWSEKSLPDRSAFFYFIITLLVFETVMGGIFSFPPERQVLEKERASGSYRLSAYFMAKSFAEAPLKLVLPTIFYIISYWMAGVSRSPGIFFGILGFLLLTVFLAESFGLMLGALLRDIQHAVATAVVVMISVMLLGGFYVQNMPSWLSVWASWLSFFRYPYGAALQLQFMDSKAFQCVDGSYIDSCRNNPNGTFTDMDAMNHFKVGIHIGLDFLIELCMIVVFRFVAYLSLRFIRNNNGRT